MLQLMNQPMEYCDAYCFRGYDILRGVGGFNEKHLSKIHDCMADALMEYHRVCMMRFDLHVPSDYQDCNLYHNTLMYRFFASLKAKLIHAQDRAAKLYRRIHKSRLRYVWCREMSTNQVIHYHVGILLNYDAYAFMGRYDTSRDNMYSRIFTAWESALGAGGLCKSVPVHIPENAVYKIVRDDRNSFNAAFLRLSYLAKLDTKMMHNGYHVFGSSRNQFLLTTRGNTPQIQS